MKKNLIQPLLLLIVITIFAAGQYFATAAERNKGDDEIFSSKVSNVNGVQSLYLPVMQGDLAVGNIFGLQLSKFDDANGLGIMEDVGFQWIRKNGLRWSDVERNPGERRWDRLVNLDAELIRAAQGNHNVVLIVRSTPDWAQEIPGIGCGPISPDDLALFGDFVFDMVSRYKQPPFGIKYWEAWNEPDVSYEDLNGDHPFGCWGDKDDPYYGGGVYASMLEVFHANVKAADPDAKVLVGGLLLDCDPINPPEIPPESGNFRECDPSHFLEGILRYDNNKGKKYFDGVSFHAYDFYSPETGYYGNLNWNSGWFPEGANYPPNIKTVAVKKVFFIKSVLNSYGAGDKFLMNTEAGLICGGFFDLPGREGCEAEDDSPFEILKASYVGQSFADALALGLKANYWYTPLGWRNSGLLYDDLSPRPAFFAYQMARDTLRGAEFVRKVTEFAGVNGYIFKVGSRHIWMLWSKDGDNHTINFTQFTYSIRDAVGNPVGGSPSNLLVTNTTLYLETNP